VGREKIKEGSRKGRGEGEQSRMEVEGKRMGRKIK
jgi:hypothetical protein